MTVQTKKQSYFSRFAPYSNSGTGFSLSVVGSTSKPRDSSATPMIIPGINAEEYCLNRYHGDCGDIDKIEEGKPAQALRQGQRDKLNARKHQSAASTPAQGR